MPQRLLEQRIEGDVASVDDRMALHGATLVLDGDLQKLRNRNLTGERPQQVLTDIQPFQHEVGDRRVLPDISLHIDIFRCQ